MVEDAFGILVARFRILQTTINIIKPENINFVVLACCVLHNYLRRKSKGYSSLSTCNDHNNTLNHLQENYIRNSTEEAKLNRQNYCEYFNGPGKVNWQDEMLLQGRA